VIAIRDLGRGIKKRFILLRLDGLQVKVEIVDMGVFHPSSMVCGPLVLQVLLGYELSCVLV
jgi:hypothetical protein